MVHSNYLFSSSLAWKLLMYMRASKMADINCVSYVRATSGSTET
jgi:hypothetical protein